MNEMPSTCFDCRGLTPLECYKKQDDVQGKTQEARGLQIKHEDNGEDVTVGAGEAKFPGASNPRARQAAGVNVTRREQAPNPADDQYHLSNQDATLWRDPCRAARDFIDLTGRARNRLCKELQKNQQDHDLYSQEGILIEGIKGSSVYAFVKGPADSPYENEVYRLRIAYSQLYPFSPPELFVVSRPPLHCNVDDFGKVCMDVLQSAWSPAMMPSQILVSFLSLLSDSECVDPLNGKAAELFEKSPRKLSRHAKSMVSNHPSMTTRALMNELIRQRS